MSCFFIDRDNNFLAYEKAVKNMQNVNSFTIFKSKQIHDYIEDGKNNLIGNVIFKFYLYGL
jgi:hypothetical protein